MSNFKVRKRKYKKWDGTLDYVQEIQCPVCKIFMAQSSTGSWVSPKYNQTGVLLHINKQAQKEISLFGKLSSKTPHFKYYLKNTKLETYQVRKWK